MRSRGCVLGRLKDFTNAFDCLIICINSHISICSISSNFNFRLLIENLFYMQTLLERFEFFVNGSRHSWNRATHKKRVLQIKNSAFLRLGLRNSVSASTLVERLNRQTYFTTTRTWFIARCDHLRWTWYTIFISLAPVPFFIRFFLPWDRLS